MTEEKTTTAQTPTAPVAEQPAAPETPAPVAEAAPAPAPAPEKKDMQPKITVTSAPKQHRPGSFNPNDRAAKKQWIAQKNKEHQDMLIAAGYSATATIAIMRYLSQNHGYEATRSKDHLILMFEGFAKSVKYRMPMFDIQVSSQMIVLLISVCEHLTRERDLFKMEAKDAAKFVSKAVDAAWKHGAKDNSNPNVDMQRLKQFFLRAINPAIPEGYAQRAQYFIECIIDVAMKTMIDPFEGLFHTEELEMPEEMKKKQKKYQFPDVFCPKCKEKMKWVYPLHRHICTNPLCEDYRPPRNRPRQDGDGATPRPPRKYSKEHQGGYDSGKPIAQESGAERFKKRYARKPLTPEQEAKKRERKAMHEEMNRMSAEADKFAQAANPFAALDALKIHAPDAEAPKEPTPPPETPAPEAPKETQEAPAVPTPDGGEQLPPPPPEVPVA